MKGKVAAIIIFIVAAMAQAVQSENILENPGFEEGQETPESWFQGAAIEDVRYVWSQDTGFKSTASVSLQKNAKNYFPIAQWFQIVQREGSAPRFEVSAEVKAENVTKAVIDVIFFDENGKSISHKWVSHIGQKKQEEALVNHDWKKYSGIVQIPPRTAKIQVALQIYGPGKVWFDDISAAYVQ